jgi:ATP-dependent helicase/nuclease subunit A
MLRIYSSSAGSGKTYTLTREYLRLALDPAHDKPGERGGSYYRHILAITFTNAAANEMKDRILKVLGQLATRQPTPYTAELVEALYGVTTQQAGYEPAMLDLCARAETAFHRVLHGYSDFAVTTIDSFMQRLVMAFTDELGLPYSFEVEMETEDVLDVAIDNLIEKAGTDANDEITEILRDIYNDHARDGENWNLLPELLREFGKYLTSDQVYEQVRQVLDLSPADIRQVQRQIRAYLADCEDKIRQPARQGWQLIEANELEISDFFQKKAGIGTYFLDRCDAPEKASGDEFRLYKDPNSYVRKVETEGKWYTPDKKNKARQDRIDAIADELLACYRQIETARDAHKHTYELAVGLLDNLHKLALLRQIRAEFDALLRKDGRVHISEFNKRILGIVATEPVPFLFERLGTKYYHILIDEFQDTSKLQFANLMPLIENALASQHDNLAVGDGKQAIYRFRGGDMDQIVALHGHNLAALVAAHGTETWTADRINALAGKIDARFLDTNWRSAEPIVRFNNAFFDFAASRFAPDHARLRDVYDEVGKFQQKPAPNARPDAHVQIDFVQKTDQRDLTGEMVARTLAVLQEARDAGYNYGDIAILCRSKRDARAIAGELNFRHIPLVSADSLTLGLSEPVRFLTALLELLNRPDLKKRRYEVLFLYYRIIENRAPDAVLTEALHEVAEAPLIDAMYEFLAGLGYPLDPDALCQLPVYELVETLTRQFGLFTSAINQPFLFRFADEVLTFSQKQSSHLSDWLTYWESVKNKVSVQGSGANAVSIQTIHKSKGLEFPVVIVPFANWGIEPRKGSELWLDLSDIPAAMLDVSKPDNALTDSPLMRLTTAPVRLNKSLGRTPDATAGQYRTEMTQTFLENMNLLYVALTRPTDRLYLIGEAKDFQKEGDTKNISYWLHEFLNSDAAQQAGCAWNLAEHSYQWACGGPAPDRAAQASPASGAGSEPVIAVRQVVSGSRGQHLQLRRQADRVFDVATFARTRDRHRKLSAALSLIRGAGCIAKTLRQLIGEGTIRATELDDLTQTLHTIAGHPDLRDVFDASLRIDTDRSILHRNQRNAAPHRVVHRADGSVVLVQYESADAPTDAPDAKTLRYFVGLYHSMGYPLVEGRLVFLSDPLLVVLVGAEESV